MRADMRAQTLNSVWVSSESMAWVLPPLTNSLIIIILGLYIALNMTPSIDCYWEGAVHNL